MTEIADLQISAFVDDELSRDECEFLVRRLGLDAAARRRLLRYHTIGAALRGELLGPDPDILRRRISGSLEGVHLPTRPAEPVMARTYHRYLRPALGAAIAASVAVAAVLVLRVGSSGLSTVDSTVADGRQTSPSPAATVTSDLPRSYVIPASLSSQYSMTMTDYIMQHNQYAPAIRSLSINSSVAGEHQYRAAPVVQTIE